MANSKNLSMSLLEPSKFKINTQYFSPHDLSLFVESLETITRLTRAKEERKEQQQMQELIKMGKKFSFLPRISSMSTLDSSSSSSCSSMVTSGDEAELLLENKEVPRSPDSERSDYDESYFSAPNSSQSSPRNSALYQQLLSKQISHSKLSVITNSDSEESGVFPIGSSQQILNDSPNGSDTIKSRSKIITKTRSLATRSRLIDLVMKKEKSKVPSVELISCRALDEYETLKMYEQQQQQQQILQTELVQESEKLTRFSTLHMKKKTRQGFACSEGSQEERFLDKALRYLTL